MASRSALTLALVPGWQYSASHVFKRLSLIRHAEGWHNKDHRELPNYDTDKLGHTMHYWDAKLTPDGEAQAARLSTELAPQLQAGLPQLVVVSPLTRTLQTASIAFPSGGPRPPMVATSLARERIGLHTCDRRRPRSALAVEFPHVDFSEVTSEEDEMWDHKEDPPNGSHLPQYSTRCSARASRLLEWLWRRPETDLALVSHWVFLRHLLRPFDHPELHQTFGNAEQRQVTLLLRNASGDGTSDEVPSSQNNEL